MRRDWDRQRIPLGRELVAANAVYPGAARVGELDLASHVGQAHGSERHPFVAGEPPSGGLGKGERTNSTELP